MAIAKTGAMYKSFTFDGEDSRDYGVYISGDGVFNAPERDVEMIEIPGRNGAYALDHGRFRNIEITYPAGLFGDTEADFAQGISALRNALCSRKGYCRLEDEYNPSEYRLAVYKSGLEVTPAQLKAGEFPITFECQPQRYLKSGETALEVSSGDTINNPTLFDASPVLSFSASDNGVITIGDNSISIMSALYGVTALNLTRAAATEVGYDFVDQLTINNTDVYNLGDTITLQGAEASFIYTLAGKAGTPEVTAVSNATATAARSGSNKNTVRVSADPAEFIAGTSSTVTASASVQFNYTGYPSETQTFTITMAYDGNATITVRFAAPTYTRANKSEIRNRSNYSATVDSTVSNLTGEVIIDTETGLAYGDNSGTIVSLNSFIGFIGDLPVLQPGTNTITFDNTITDMKVTPRWWEV